MAKQPIWQVFVPMRHLGAREGNNNDDSCHSYLPQVVILSPTISIVIHGLGNKRLDVHYRNHKTIACSHTA